MQSKSPYLQIAREALKQYELPASRIRQISDQENVTFQIRLVQPLTECSQRTDDFDPNQLLLRLHRPQGHVRARLWNLPEVVRSELQWLERIRQNTPLAVPVALLSKDGTDVITVPATDARIHTATLMRWVRGRNPTVTPSRKTAFLAGQVLAHAHNVSENWVGSAAAACFADEQSREHENFSWKDRQVVLNRLRVSSEVVRPLYDRAMLIEWQRLILERAISLELPARIADFISRTLDRAEHVLADLTATRENFGLIHADFVPSNYLVYRGECRPIDFSCCGFGWYLQDVGNAIVQLTTDAHASLLRGYNSIRALSDADGQLIRVFHLLGRASTILEYWPEQCIYTPFDIPERE